MRLCCLWSVAAWYGIADIEGQTVRGADFTVKRLYIGLKALAFQWFGRLLLTRGGGPVFFVFPLDFAEGFALPAQSQCGPTGIK